MAKPTGLKISNASTAEEYYVSTNSGYSVVQVLSSFLLILCYVLRLLVLSFYFSLELLCGPDGELPEKLRNLEPHLIEHISNEIMDKDPNVRWDDIGNYNN